MLEKANKRMIVTYVVAAAVCLCFLASSVLFMLYVLRHNEEENMQYLYGVAEQNRTALLKQIQGDYQTLDGVAICIGNADISDPEKLRGILQEINAGSSFVRMGLSDAEGKLDLLDIDGSVYQDVDISGRPFFARVKAGENAVSQAIRDSFGDGYILYYGVPVTRDGAFIGALCAVNTADTFRRIIDASVLNGRGFSNLISSAGDVVIHSSHPDAARAENSVLAALESSDPSERERITGLLAQGESGEFTYTVDNEVLVAVFEPLGINDWFVLSVVPQTVLKQRYNIVIVGIAAMILVACSIFLFLLNRQRRMMAKNKEDLMHLAYDDPLTGCRNYTKFLLDGNALLQSGPGRFAVWYFDLKKFKYINDIFGYHTGDLVLRKMAELFEKYAGDGEIFGRVSGDNFVGIRPYREQGELSVWFEKLRFDLCEQELDALQQMPTALCMGFYCVEENGGERLPLNDMVNRANMAQKSVKTKSGSRCAFFTQEIRSRIHWESELETRARRALEQGEFVLYFQPKVNIQEGNRLAGAEALTRWVSPDHGLIPPGEFIPLFEKNGFIVQMDRWMFEQVCRWLQGYLSAGNPPINIAVNVSRLGLLQEDFVDYYAAVKERYGIPDRLLELEFTESIIMEDDFLFRDTVVRMQQKGFICSLDDFGAGYSSLNLLKNLPIDVLKLDVLFFKRGVDIRRERVVVANIISMARELHIKTIAEGVEKTEQIEFLRRSGCDIVQGYVFSRPVPLAEFDALAAPGHGRPVCLEPQDADVSR